MFRKQYTPDFFAAEHYGLRNTIPPEGLRISPREKRGRNTTYKKGTKLTLFQALLPVCVKQFSRSAFEKVANVISYTWT
jgi:hypothetical protein